MPPTLSHAPTSNPNQTTTPPTNIQTTKELQSQITTAVATTLETSVPTLIEQLKSTKTIHYALESILILIIGLQLARKKRKKQLQKTTSTPLPHSKEKSHTNLETHKQPPIENKRETSPYRKNAQREATPTLFIMNDFKKYCKKK